MSSPVAPLRTINPEFRRAVYQDPRPGYALGLAIGFGHSAGYYAVFNNTTIAATPLMCSRLRMLADLIGFTGDVWLPGETERPFAQARLHDPTKEFGPGFGAGDKFDVDTIPTPTQVRPQAK